MNTQAQTAALIMDAKAAPMEFDTTILNSVPPQEAVSVLLALVEALRGTVEYLEKEAGFAP